MAIEKHVKHGYGDDHEEYFFLCPGCKDWHYVLVRYGDTYPKGFGVPQWEFNGDIEKPTFSPSLLVTSGHYCRGQEGKECWCTFEERFGKEPGMSCYICHSFVRDGKIEFLSDCTHELAGQTVPV